MSILKNVFFSALISGGLFAAVFGSGSLTDADNVGSSVAGKQVVSATILNIGDAPINFTRPQYDESCDISLSSYSGKTVLVSFIDFNNGWDWLKNLLNIQSAITAAGIASKVQIVAVIYQYMSAVGASEIDDKVSEDPDLPGPGEWPFPVCVDLGWASSYAYQYQNGFVNTVDPLFHGNCGTALWSYLISSDYKVTDKWHPNITTVGDPISFNRLTNVGTFDSSNLSASKAFVVQRLVNLCAAPKILYSNPVSGSSLSSVNTVKLICSKPLGSGASLYGNYYLGGTVSGLTITGVSYSGADKAENVLTLLLSGTPSIGALTVNAGSSVTDTAGNAFQSGGNSVSYTIP